MGLPRRAAQQVAQGQRSLNDVLQEMARTEKADKLVAERGLQRSFAVQVVLGQASLEDFLERQARHAYRRENGHRSCFDAAAASGEPLTLALLGRALRTLRILAVEKYELQVQDEGAEPERLHKLQVKLCYAPVDRKAVRRAWGVDKALKDAVAEPQWRIQDRYRCPDKVLHPWLMQGQRVAVTLVEGERLQGVIGWYSRYEIGLQVRDAQLTVMRHALVRVEVS
jgi:sRNA-binding regulator protein Hfq